MKVKIGRDIEDINKYIMNNTLDILKRSTTYTHNVVIM